MYERWCDATKEKDKRKRYWTYVEKDGGRDEIREDLAETIRSHYDRLERIAEDVERLGYKVAVFAVSTRETKLGTSRREDFWFIVAARSEDEAEIRAA